MRLLELAIKDAPTIDLDAVEFESFSWADEYTTETGITLIFGWEDCDDGVKTELHLRHGRDVADSRKTAHWQHFDELFGGREHWQTWLQKKAKELEKEYLDD